MQHKSTNYYDEVINKIKNKEKFNIDEILNIIATNKPSNLKETSLRFLLINQTYYRILKDEDFIKNLNELENLENEYSHYVNLEKFKTYKYDIMSEKKQDKLNVISNYLKNKNKKTLKNLFAGKSLYSKSIGWDFLADDFKSENKFIKKYDKDIYKTHKKINQEENIENVFAHEFFLDYLKQQKIKLESKKIVNSKKNNIINNKIEKANNSYEKFILLKAKKQYELNVQDIKLKELSIEIINKANQLHQTVIRNQINVLNECKENENFQNLFLEDANFNFDISYLKIFTNIFKNKDFYMIFNDSKIKFPLFKNIDEFLSNKELNGENIKNNFNKISENNIHLPLKKEPQSNKNYKNSISEINM